jgi:hypothetical protein
MAYPYWRSREVGMDLTKDTLCEALKDSNGIELVGTEVVLEWRILEELDED